MYELYAAEPPAPGAAEPPGAGVTVGPARSPTTAAHMQPFLPLPPLAMAPPGESGSASERYSYANSGAEDDHPVAGRALLWQLLRQLLAARKGKGKGKPLRLAAWLERSAAD